MASSSPSAVALPDLPLEVLTGVCLQLDLHGLIRVSETCTRFRHGDGGLETLELPTKSPVVTALRELAFPGGVGIPSTRTVGCFKSWVAYLARCARQRHCRQAPSIAAGNHQSVFLVASGQLLACGKGFAVGHGDEKVKYSCPTPVAAMAGIRMRSVAAGLGHSLALGWDGRVYSWGANSRGQLGHGNQLAKASPALVEALESVRSIAASDFFSLAVTQSGSVFQWGEPFRRGAEDSPRPITVEGFGGVRVRCVCGGYRVAFAIGEKGELFSWGSGKNWRLGHGDTQDQPSPKRIEALKGVRVSSVSVGCYHALALTEDGLVYAWGENRYGALLGDPHVERELQPKPVEALRAVRVGSVAAAGARSYAVSDTGELWAWGIEGVGHGEQTPCPLPKPIESLRGIKVDAVAASDNHALALADDGSVYAWGNWNAAQTAALGLGPSVSDAGACVPTPQHVPELRVACGL
jgi:alpha-tubulin suppressor-like RCC1 family protein